MICYPGMFSHLKLKGDLPDVKQSLPEYYESENFWQYFEKEETFYSDSNYFENPFEEEHNPDFEEYYPLRRSDSYDILGLDRDSSKEEIKMKFRKLALETHPDKGGSEAEFIKVREAYEQLMRQLF
tara:strand:+ start:597 stop:974 length:378 start_codon:yes stop_codon:yes gene_type:complete